MGRKLHHYGAQSINGRDTQRTCAQATYQQKRF